ncbi:hypothetical protein V6M85_07950 [Sulfolobus tengchongensis]|uniref:PIN domain-containing protein n=1 Tax=Sulfolobus tengchongensis TaxID=207809 RepID=A0AAX4KXU6_9CREN
MTEYKKDIESNFRILCLDNESVKISSRIYAELKRKGELIDDPDLIIGSICIANKLSLVTNNVKHYERLKEFGLKVILANELI